MKCRLCKNELTEKFLDLGNSPPSNSYLNNKEEKIKEKTFPLKVMICKFCWLLQTIDYTKKELLFTNDYAYFSSTSESWIEKRKKFVMSIIKQLKLDKKSLVIEIASNDGYLLENFLKTQIKILGIEPTHSTARISLEKGIPTLQKFFSSQLATELSNNNNKADLIIANNVIAHVPDLNDFIIGLSILLKNNGLISIEFPHVLNLIKFKQFDTIYHEHFSYFSLHSIKYALNKNNLEIVNVKKIKTHGGSLRLSIASKSNQLNENKSVLKLLNEEKKFGILNISKYKNFEKTIAPIADNLKKFLIFSKNNSLKVIAYGVVAKGNTLLNYSKIDNSLISYVLDAAPSKQGKFLPGTHIPILHPNEINKITPDIILILPWNIANEIKGDICKRYKFKLKFFIAIPKLMEI